MTLLKNVIGKVGRRCFPFCPSKSQQFQLVLRVLVEGLSNEAHSLLDI